MAFQYSANISVNDGAVSTGNSNYQDFGFASSGSQFVRIANRSAATIYLEFDSTAATTGDYALESSGAVMGPIFARSVAFVSSATSTSAGGLSVTLLALSQQ